jgi:hypothetical protein
MGVGGVEASKARYKRRAAMIETFNPFDKSLAEIEPADLLLLKEVHEGWYVDYKEASIRSKDYAKAISAMANTYGGWVFVGVKEASKDNNVAGSFPGIKSDKVDQTCQAIRQSVAAYLHPQPFFEIRAVQTPETYETLIVCVYIPASPKAPIIHSDGRIYRRINDSSEPVPESNRDAVEHLFKRTERFEQTYAEWYARDPELSEHEKNTSYLRIIAFPDYWNEQKLWCNGNVEEFREVLRARDEGTFFSQPFNNVYSRMDGFVARTAQPKDARQLTSTLIMYRNYSFDFVTPIPSYDVDQYHNHFEERPNFAEALQYLSSNDHHHSTVLDLSMIFGPLDALFTLMKRFQKHAGYQGDTFFKFKLGNVWRRIPVLSLTPEEHGWDQYGPPMILTENISLERDGDISTFIRLSLNNETNPENPAFMLSMPLFAEICVAMGLAAGNQQEFAERITSAVHSALDGADKTEGAT